MSVSGNPDRPAAAGAGGEEAGEMRKGAGAERARSFLPVVRETASHPAAGRNRRFIPMKYTSPKGFGKKFFLYPPFP